MNSTQIALHLGLLTAEILLTAFLFVLVFRGRRVLGYVPMYVAVGAFQVLLVLLSLSVYVPFAPSVQISPGSAVLLPATIFAVLLVYIAEDAPAARRLIYGIVIANVTLSVLAVLFGEQIVEGRGLNPVQLPPEVFRDQPSMMLLGTAVLFMDVVLVIVFYEAISKVLRSTYARLLLASVAVLWLDTLAFASGSMFLTETAAMPLMISGVVGKTFSATIYSAVFTYFVLRPGLHLSAEEREEEFGDVFRALTYRQRYEQAKEMALRDPLTGLYNRRYFNDGLAREAEHAVRYETPLALILLDIDFFKAVNDRFGHQEGDRALRLVSGAIARTVRSSDIACRVGGEEFGIIAPRATEDIAMLLAQRIRDALAEDYRAAQPPFKMDELTVTVGLTAIDGQEADAVKTLPDRMYQIADRRLYLGKQTGRNRIVVWSAETEPPGLAMN